MRSYKYLLLAAIGCSIEYTNGIMLEHGACDDHSTQDNIGDEEEQDISIDIRAHGDILSIDIKKEGQVEALSLDVNIVSMNLANEEQAVPRNPSFDKEADLFAYL